MKKIVFYLLLLLQITIEAPAREQVPRVKWRFHTDGAIRAGAVLDGNELIFGNSAGTVHSIDKSHGRLNWQFKTSGAITASPAVSESMVIVVSRDDYVYALDRDSGKLNWKFKTGQMVAAVNTGWKYFMAAPVIRGDYVYIGSGDSYLYALKLKNGKPAWKFKTQGRIRATPLIHNNTIYQPSNDGHVYALNALTGESKWKFTTKGASIDPSQFPFDRRSVYDQPDIRNGLLVFGSRDGHVYGVNLETHEAEWTFSYGPTWAMSSTLDESTAYVGWSTNNLSCAINLASGEKKWEFKSGAHVYTSPLLHRDAVVIGSADGYVYKLDKETGKMIWRYEIGAEVYSSPVTDGSSFYFGSDDGNLYALEEAAKAHQVVYQPDSVTGNAQYLVFEDGRLAPYLVARGFSKLNQAELVQFVKDRIEDRAPGVIVFAHPLIPRELLTPKPAEGLLRKYLEAGGKVVWPGDVPNFYEPDAQDNFKRDPATGTELLEVDFIAPTEGGNYVSKATQEGRNWGLLSWFKSTAATVAASDDIIPLAYDEFGNISAWYKSFHPRMATGFVSCRTWAWSVPIRDHQMEIIYKLAVYGLE